MKGKSTMIIGLVLDYFEYLIEHIIDFQNDIFMTFWYIWFVTFLVWLFRKLINV